MPGELEYFKQRLADLGRDYSRLEASALSLRRRLAQREQVLALQEEMQHATLVRRDLASVFDDVTRSVSTSLGMDRAVVLTPRGAPGRLEATHTFGYGGAEGDALRRTAVDLPLTFVEESTGAIVNGGSPRSALGDVIGERLGLPYFVALPVHGDAGLLAVLVAGRTDERPPFVLALNDGDLASLTLMAGLITAADRQDRIAALEARVSEQQARMHLASQIQGDLLPTKSPEIAGYDLAGRTISAQVVGGDYFDFITVDGSRLAICLGDIAGKGLPASLLMANLQATIRGQALWSPSARDCVTRANHLLFQSTADSRYATLFYCVLNPRSHWCLYSNAGHNPPLLVRGDAQVLPLSAGGTVIGLFTDAAYEEEVQPIEAGDTLVLYSDGITEAAGTNEEEFGVERLTALVRQHRGLSAGDLVDLILASATDHVHGAPQGDDMTVVVLKRL